MLLGVRREVIYLRLKKPYLRASDIARRVRRSRERIRQILKSERLRTTIIRVVSLEVNKRVQFIDSEYQPHLANIDYCADCGRELIGRGKKRIDRKEMTEEYPLGKIYCNKCANIHGLKCFIPCYKYRKTCL